MLSHIFLIMVSILNPMAPRCWIGIVDRVEPPWLVIVGEREEQVKISLAHSYPETREGDWVIYWTQQGIVERIDSPYSRAETEAQRQLMRSLFELP